jgi:hypothetical protein
MFLTGICNLFSGLIVRPQFMIGTFYALPYYISPGHYVYQGMIISIYNNNSDPVAASNGSDFYTWLVDAGICSESSSSECIGTAGQYVNYFFDGNFTSTEYSSGLLLPIIVLTVILVFSRVFTWLALKYIRFG